MKKIDRGVHAPTLADSIDRLASFEDPSRCYVNTNARGFWGKFTGIDAKHPYAALIERLEDFPS
jgi:hypothetical protein